MVLSVNIFGLAMSGCLTTITSSEYVIAVSVI